MLMMTSNKLQQFAKLFSRFKPHQRVLPKTYKFASRIYSIPVQSTLHLSTSAVVKSQSKVMSEKDKATLNLHYEDILKAQQDDSILIIDVREQDEINETGKLPGSIHIPMGEVSTVLMNLPDKDFKERFNKDKPSKATKIILSCRSGKRSGMVQEEIQKLGYQNAYNYVGGWLDWESNQKT